MGWEELEIEEELYNEVKDPSVDAYRPPDVLLRPTCGRCIDITQRAILHKNGENLQEAECNRCGEPLRNIAPSSTQALNKELRYRAHRYCSVRPNVTSRAYVEMKGICPMFIEQCMESLGAKRFLPKGGTGDLNLHRLCFAIVDYLPVRRSLPMIVLPFVYSFE